MGCQICLPVILSLSFAVCLSPGVVVALGPGSILGPEHLWHLWNTSLWFSKRNTDFCLPLCYKHVGCLHKGQRGSSVKNIEFLKACWKQTLGQRKETGLVLHFPHLRRIVMEAQLFLGTKESIQERCFTWLTYRKVWCELAPFRIQRIWCELNTCGRTDLF